MRGEGVTINHWHQGRFLKQPKLRWSLLLLKQQRPYRDVSCPCALLARSHSWSWISYFLLSKLSRGRRFFLPFTYEDEGGAVAQPLLPAAGRGVRCCRHKPLMSCWRSWARHGALRSAPWHRRSRLYKSGCRVHRSSILARSGVQRQPHASASPAGTTVLTSSA